MDYQALLEAIKKNNQGTVPQPIQALGKLDENLVLDHFKAKNFALSEGVVPLKYKNLILFASAIVQDAPSCIMTNMKAARAYGKTLRTR